MPVKIKLNSPYGAMRTVGGGRIENGTVGEIKSKNATGTERVDVFFDGEMGIVSVPAHWISFLKPGEK